MVDRSRRLVGCSRPPNAIGPANCQLRRDGCSGGAVPGLWQSREHVERSNGLPKPILLRSHGPCPSTVFRSRYPDSDCWQLHPPDCRKRTRRRARAWAFAVMPRSTEAPRRPAHGQPVNRGGEVRHGEEQLNRRRRVAFNLEDRVAGGAWVIRAGLCRGSKVDGSSGRRLDDWTAEPSVFSARMACVAQNCGNRWRPPREGLVEREVRQETMQCDAQYDPALCHLGRNPER